MDFLPLLNTFFARLSDLTDEVLDGIHNAFNNDPSRKETVFGRMDEPRKVIIMDMVYLMSIRGSFAPAAALSPDSATDEKMMFLIAGVVQNFSIPNPATRQALCVSLVQLLSMDNDSSHPLKSQLRLAIPELHNVFKSLETHVQGRHRPLTLDILGGTPAGDNLPIIAKLKAMFTDYFNLIVLMDRHLTDHQAIAMAEFARFFNNESPETEERESLDDLLKKLDLLVGLDAVKDAVFELVNFLKVQQLRKDAGFSTTSVSQHMVFHGNPGTGKTTVARILARIFRALNFLEKGHLVEVDRSGLVAGYIGQTAIKVTDAVKRALGGVLFIDEAYSLATEPNGRDSYGQEAINTLVKLMEDHRHNLIVIVAGYVDKMNTFLSSNPGLKSRFNREFYFEDYTPPQLSEIFNLYCAENSYRLTEDARKVILNVCQDAWAGRNDEFGNGRFVRNMFERTIKMHANRVSGLKEVSEEALCTIMAEDIHSAAGPAARLQNNPARVEFEGKVLNQSTQMIMGRVDSLSPANGPVSGNEPASSVNANSGGPQYATWKEYLTALITEGKYTRSEITTRVIEKFPGVKKTTVSTVITDGRNPKYNKLRALVTEKDGKLTFGE